VSDHAFLLTLGLIIHNGRTLRKIGSEYWLVDRNGRRRAHRAISLRMVDRLLVLMEPDTVRNGEVVFRFKAGVDLPDGIIVPNIRD
jgi:hypothetical protein